MPDLILNREQSRRVDVLAVDDYGMSGLVLMENAGRGAAEIVRRVYDSEPRLSRPVVICCGKGNNGGDGFVVARYLDLAGVPVRVVLFCDPKQLTGDAAANYKIALLAGLVIDVCHKIERVSDLARIYVPLGDAALIVDALLGTGSKGEPRPPLDQHIKMINSCSAPRIAIDIPSGLDCDTGEPAKQTIRAARTITFVARKPGFANPIAQPYVGEVDVVDIGVPRKLLQEIVAGKK